MSFNQEIKNSSIKSALGYLLALVLLGITKQTIAATFLLPENGNDIVGSIQAISIQNPKLTLLDIARHYDLSQEEIGRANPDVSLWVPKLNDKVVIPTQFMLPDTVREGIVINIAQRRLFYYPKPGSNKKPRVITYPISIAREGWQTPLGLTSITAKHRDPSWFVPKSIKQEHLHSGEIEFPDYFPPGPDNPMGMLALQTGFPGIFIHGTNMPWGIGLRTSHGCIHLYPEDAAELFPMIQTGTPVRIMNESVLVGAKGNFLYLSVFKPIDNSEVEISSSSKAASAVYKYVLDHDEDISYIDWHKLQEVANKFQNMLIPITSWSPDYEDIVSSLEVQPYAREPYGIDANAAAPPKYRK